MDNVGPFLKDLIHELNDPLNALSGALEVWPTLPPAGQDELHPALMRNTLILGQALRQVSCFVQLLDESDNEPVEQTADLRDCITSACQDCRPFIEQRRQQTVLELPSEPVWASFDSDKARTGLGLITGGLSRSCPQEETFHLILETGPEFATFAVEIARSSLELKQTGFRQQILERIARALGGSLETRSEENFTRVALAVPYSAAAAGPASYTASSNVARSQPRLLVVDDNRDGADTLAMWLEAKGYLVSVSYAGSTAMEAFSTFQPSAVLLDIGLPGRSGYEIAAEMRSEGFRGLLVATTGYGQEKDRSQALAVGFDHHLVKPVALEQLGHILERFFAAPRTALVVEDNPIALQALAAQLKSLGLETYQAATAEAALKLIEEKSFDLILSDLGLPGSMDGMDLARAIRSRKSSKVTLVAVTGSAASARQEALAAGFDQVLEKPMTRERLEQLLANPI